MDHSGRSKHCFLSSGHHQKTPQKQNLPCP
jgi:hypothetical protein